MSKDSSVFDPQITVQPQQAPDIQSSYQALSDSLGAFKTGVVSTLQKPIEFQAIQKGKEAGEKEDYTPSGIPITPIAIAERQTAMQSHQSVILNDVKSQISKLHLKYTTPKSSMNPNGGIGMDSLPKFQAETEGWFQGYMAHTPKVFQSTAKTAFADYARTAQTSLVKQTGDLVQKQQAFNIMTGVDQIKTDAMNAAYSNDPKKADALYSSIQQKLSEGVATGSYSEAQAFNILSPFKKQLTQEKYVGNAKDSWAHGVLRQDWAEKVQNNKSLGSVEKDKIIQQGLATYKQLDDRAKASGVQLDEQRKQNLEQQLVGGKEDPALATKIEKASPIAAHEYAIQSERNQHFSDLTDKLRYTSPKDSQEYFDSHKLDQKDPNLEENQIQLTALKNWNQSRLHQFVQDRATYTQNAPYVQQMMENLKTTKPYQDANNDQRLQMEKLIQSKAQVVLQKSMGTLPNELSVLTPEDKRYFADNFYNSGAKGKQNFVNDMAASYGDNADIALRDLSKLGVPQNIMDLANLDKFKDSKAQLPVIFEGLDAQDIWKDTVSKTGNTKGDYDVAAQAALSDILPTIGDTGKNGIDYRNNMQQLVARSAAAYDIKNVTSFNSSKSTQIMADAIYNNRYSAIGDTYRVPKNVDPKTAGDAMYAMKQEIDGTNFTPLSRLPTTLSLRPEDIKKQDVATISGGHWVSYHNDKGVYWVDHMGIAATHANSKLHYDILWKDLYTPNSDINKLIHKHPRSFIRRLF